MSRLNSIFFSLLLLINFQLSAQTGIQWSAPQIVSATDGDKSPVVAAFNDGSVAAVWGKGSAIYFSRIVNGAFLDPVVIPTPGVAESIYSFGGLDMVIFENNIYIMFESFADGLFQIRSTDGGETFESPMNIFDPPSGMWATLSSLAITEDGMPMVSAILETTSETDGRIIFLRSLDHGVTYEDGVIASEPARGDFVCECCTPDLYTQGNDVWLIFRNNNNNLRDMWVSKSSDGGASFTEAIDVDDTNWVINACPISGPKISAMGGDSLISVWSSGADGTNKIYFSTLDGQTMEKGVEVQIPRLNANSFQSYPTVAGANDTVGVVWEESGFGANAGDLIFALSTNGSGDLLSNLANITQTPGSQRYPSLMFLNGVFHLLHTNGSGGLEYRRGVVSSESGIQERNEFTECIQLIEQPTTDREIRLYRSCPFELNVASLYDILGNKVRTWKLDGNNDEINLPIEHLSSGMYILILDTQHAAVSQLVLIEN